MEKAGLIKIQPGREKLTGCPVKRISIAGTDDYSETADCLTTRKKYAYKLKAECPVINGMAFASISGQMTHMALSHICRVLLPPIRGSKEPLFTLQQPVYFTFHFNLNL